MFVLPLHLPSRPLRCASRSAGVFAGLIVLGLICGCQDRKITLTDFSRTFTLQPPAAGAAVVGLVLETELDASAQIHMHIGCKGDVKVRLAVPNGRKFRQRTDWYSDCAELSFATGNARAKSISIKYRFQTL